jgi:hypothetical protein
MVPTGDSASAQEEIQQSQLKQTGVDILQGSAQTGQLTNGALYWNPDSEQWHNPSGVPTVDRSDPRPHMEYSKLPGQHPMWPPLEVLTNDDIMYNMQIQHLESPDTRAESQYLVYQGVPSSNAVVVEYSVVLYEDDPLISADGDPMIDGEDVDCPSVSNGEEVTIGKISSPGGCEYFMPNAFENSPSERYNVVRVQMTLWA